MFVSCLAQIVSGVGDTSRREVRSFGRASLYAGGPVSVKLHQHAILREPLEREDLGQEELAAPKVW